MDKEPSTKDVLIANFKKAVDTKLKYGKFRREVYETIFIPQIPRNLLRGSYTYKM
jgi:hypothetical protein